MVYVLHHSLPFLPTAALTLEVGGMMLYGLTPSVGRLH